MKLAFAVLLVLHGLIHGLGVAKAFGVAVPQMATAISRPLGVLWLVAGLSYLVTAALLFVSPERWWVLGAFALIASQIAIVTAWSDAKFGTLVNAIVLVPLALSLLDLRSTSFPSIYRSEIARGLARSAPTTHVTESDLARLPAPVQTYLRRVGVVGRPRVRNFRATWHGQMRRSIDAPWMDIRAEQVEFFDEPTRLFYMEASQYGVPFQALHVYAGGAATMRVRVLSVLDIVDARGREMNRSETVTLFNDMCLLAPATLVDANVGWTPIDDRHVRATFTNAGNTISAELAFDAEDYLVSFVSHDRDQSADGKTYRNLPWATPVRDYRDYAGTRLASHGDAVWLDTSGEFVYARFELEDIEYDVGCPQPSQASPAPTSPKAVLASAAAADAPRGRGK